MSAEPKTGELVVVEEPENLLAVIARVVGNPQQLDVDKMERLLAMHQTISEEQKKVAYMAAMARVAPKLPEIFRGGTSHQGKYSRLIDIDRVVRPIISAEGLSMSFDSASVEGKPGERRIVCRNSHADGYSETKQIDLPIDSSGSKNGAQAIISTVAYGRRALTKMFYNLVEATEDTDGNDPTLITKEQVRDILTALQDTKSDKERFLKLIAGVDKIENIPANQYSRIMNALDEKRRVNQK